MAQKSKFGISQVQLTQMMDVADKRGMKRIDEHGGIEEIAAHVKTNLKNGLHPDEARSEQRLSEFGVNFVKPRPPKSFLALIFEAAQDKVLIVLLVCAFISIILSVSVVTAEERKTGWVEGFAIFLAVFIVVMVTAINDYTKERQFRELQKKLDSTSRYTLIRDGERLEVGTDEIVVGDVLEFKYGNAFPCDGLFIRGNDVSVSEASLTGESNNIKKNSTMNPFLYSGTQVMEGTGTMLVVAVGPYSQHGIILALLTSADGDDDDGFITAALKSIWKRIRPQERKPLASSRSSESEVDEKAMETDKANGDIEEEEDLDQFRMNCCQKMLHPHKWMRNKKELKKRRKKIKTEAKGSVLQRKLTRLALQIGYFGIAAAVLIVVVAILRHCIEEYAIEGRGWERNDIIKFLRFFINGLTVLVVAVPEGLPLAVTIALAYSIKKMLNDNNLVRHLHSCETMGNATCICSDKTGTLTTNRMTVVDSYIAQTRSIDENPNTKTLPVIVKETLEQTIAVNSSYSSTLKRPDNCLNAEGRSLWNKMTGVFRRRPVQQPHDNGEGGRVKTKEGSEEPLSLEELKSLVRGEEGLLVEQIGNPTECALLGLLVELDGDYDSARLQHPKEAYVKQFTFNATRKSMTTVISLPDNKGSRVLTKGASEIVLSKCTSVLSSTGEVIPLTDAMRSEILETVVCSMASKALRTIGMAYKDVPEESVSLEDAEISVLKPTMDWENENQVVSDLTLIGIVGIEDPVRPEVFESIKKCQQAGITVRMVTGDNIDTARSIAEKCGIIPKGDKTLYVLEGPKFRQKVLNENGEPVQEKLDKIWPRLRVLARSSPKDKYTLVEGIINSKITKTREVVAVTGDGTNDGPALKRADVGFAMGIAGTDVAKEACDIILTDDNFASIVKAVKWGRNIYDAISKFLQFQLTVNVVAVSIAVIGSFSIGDTPLRAIQLLWVNLVMDTFASLALATEPPTDELLKRAPYGRNKKLISRRMFLFIAGHSTYQLTTLLVLLYAGPQLFDIDKGSLEDVFAEPTQHFTLIFNTFVFMQIFNEFNARRVHGEQNVFGGMHRNIIFLCIMAVQVLFQVLWIEIPVLNREVFKATNLSIDLWLWCIFLGSVELIIGQILSLIPIEKIPEFKWPWEHEGEDHTNYWDEEDDNKAKVLWVKSLNRLQTQIRVVNAFKAGLDSGDNLHLSRLPHLTATPKSKRYYHEGSNDLDCRISDV